MKKLSVGQRVRLIDPKLPYYGAAALSGSTGVVASSAYTSIWGDTRYRVDLDGGGEAQPIPEAMVPIDDSSDLTTWEEVRKATGYVRGDTQVKA